MKKIEILIRNLILNLLLLFKRSAQKDSLPTITNETKILFIRLNRIGDALVTTPLLAKIKEQYNCSISVCADKKNYFVFERSGVVDNILTYDKKKESLFKLIRRIRKKHFDIVVDLHDDVSTTVSLVVAFLNIPYKFALNKKTRRLYSNVIPRIDPSTNHVIDRLMEFRRLFKIDIDSNEINVVFEPSVDDISITDLFLGEKYEINRFLLGINISAGSKARFWGIENYKKLILSLKKYKLNILILCSENDLYAAKEISENKLPVYWTKDFSEFSAMIKNLNFLFSPDTSIIHIASAFRIPVFGIYVKYNTNEEIWYPYKSKYKVVITEEATLENVSCETVIEKFIPFFEGIYYGAQ